MRKEVVLITGANGEIGHGLIMHLKENENIEVLAWMFNNWTLNCSLLPSLYSGRYSGQHAPWPARRRIRDQNHLSPRLHPVHQS